MIKIFLDFITKGLFGAFSQVSSVMMPASFPPRLAEITRKKLFVLKSFKSKHTLRKNYYLCILEESTETRDPCVPVVENNLMV